jgi:hypothetical protein
MDKVNTERRKIYVWNPVTGLRNDKKKNTEHNENKKEFEPPGIESILPWSVISAATRLIMVF